MSNTTTDDLDLELTDLEPREGETESDLVKRLRGTIKGQRTELKDLRPLKDRVAEQDLSKAFDTAFDKDEAEALSEAKTKAVLAVAGDDKSPESLRKAAVELGYVEARPDPREEELKGHERVAGASSGAARGAGAVIDKQVVSTWSHEKRMRFAKAQPDAWESLKRGEPVHGITF